MSSPRSTPSKSEYVQPLTNSSPSDSSLSPLALLAQTCSSIGKDLPTGTKVPPSKSTKKSVKSSSSIPLMTYLPPSSSMFDPNSAALLRSYLQAESLVQPYLCHWLFCNAKFSSNEQLIDHVRRHQTTGKVHSISPHHRFHPYYKAPLLFHANDQLPFFYPHLSLSPNKPMNNNST